MRGNILVLGPVGSGKSTQAKILADYIGVPHVSVGDLLFIVSQEETDEGKIIRETMERGGLVDDAIVLSVLNNYFEEENHASGVVMDGFPRTLKEAEHFPQKVSKVFYLKISDEEATRRLLQRGRQDDTAEVIGASSLGKIWK